MRNRKTVRKLSFGTAIDILEPRCLFDGNFYPLAASGNFVQSWTNTGLITTANDWSGVPSIVGYKGLGLSNANPSLNVGDGTLTPSVLANVSSVATTNGDVAEFQITNPTIALQGSNNAPSPNIVISLNTTGVSGINVSFNARDIDSTSDNAIQQIATQYRVGTAGNWTNLPAGYIADATGGPSQATMVTPINLTLPAAADNQAQVQVRILTGNAPSNDEWVGIDDINIGTTAVTPTAYFAAATANFAEPTNGAGDTAATLMLTRDGPTTASLLVNYTFTNGTATNGVDYVGTNGSVTFAAGSSTATIPVTIKDDSIVENIEAFSVTISTVNPANTGTPATQTVSINDNDAAPGSVLLNEVVSNPPGNDAPYEFAELIGTGSLNNIYFVSVEGDGTAAGTADLVVNLSSANFGSNGLLVITSTDPGLVTPAETAIVGIGGFTLENGANSFLLISSPTNPIVQGVDYDSTNSGTLTLPAGATLIDGFGWKDIAAGTAYGAVLSVPTTTPDAATRFLGNTTPLDPTAFYAGRLNGTSSTTDYSATLRSANFPADNGGIATGYVTPGAANVGSSGTSNPDTTPPQLTTAPVYDFETLNNVTYTFNESVSASLTAADFTLTNIGDPATAADDVTVPSSSLVVTSSPDGTGGVVTYSTGLFPNGNYTMTLTAAGVTDAAGNALSGGDVSFNFFTLAGDADRNRSVDTVDFAKLIAGFGPGTKTFSQGNFNYDSGINSIDFGILVSNFGQTLPAAPPASLPQAARASSAFASSGKVVNDLADLLS